MRLLICTLLIIGACVCDTPPDIDLIGLENTAPQIDFSKELRRISLSLGAILVLLGLTIYTLRRFAHKRAAKWSELSKIKILEQRSLSQKTLAHLVEVEGRHILITESPHGLSSVVLSGQRPFRDLVEAEGAATHSQSHLQAPSEPPE